MYHFDTSDQREKPVYISHIALWSVRISRYTIPQNSKNHQIFFDVGMPYLFYYIKLQPEIDSGITLLFT